MIIVALVVLLLGAGWLLFGGSLTGNLGYTDLLNLAQGAGFTGNDAFIAAAIALAESSGNPKAVGDNGTSIGLWQIHFTVHPQFDQAQLTDPQYNASAAFQIYSTAGNTFRPWSTFLNDAYLAFLPSSGSVTGA